MKRHAKSIRLALLRSSYAERLRKLPTELSEYARSEVENLRREIVKKELEILCEAPGLMAEVRHEENRLEKVFG